MAAQQTPPRRARFNSAVPHANAPYGALPYTRPCRTLTGDGVQVHHAALEVEVDVAVEHPDAGLVGHHVDRVGGGGDGGELVHVVAVKLLSGKSAGVG